MKKLPFRVKQTLGTLSTLALLLGSIYPSASVYAAAAEPAAANATDAVATGSLQSFSTRTTLTPRTEDVGKTIQIFVIALIADPANPQGGMLFAKTATGWKGLAADGSLEPWKQTKAETTHTVDLTQFDDVRGIAQATIYVGYGVQGNSDWAGKPLSPWGDMLYNWRYRLVYTVPAAETVAQWRLQPTNEAGLKTYLSKILVASANKGYVYPVGVSTAGSVSTANTSPIPVPSSPVADSTSASTVSGTTLQEVGVDEADLVKTDGTFIWSVLAPSIADSTVLQRHALQTSSTNLLPVDTIKLPFSQGSRLTGLFLDTTGKQLAVLGETTHNWYGGFFGVWFSSYSWAQGNTEITLVDTASPTQMKVKRHLKFNATQIGARRIGSTLYLVLRNYPNVKGYEPNLVYYSTDKAAIAANNALLENITVSEVLPQLAVDGGANQPAVDAASCYTQPDNANPTADIITIVAIDLAATTERHTAKCFTGGTEAFYMSDKSIYLATTRQTYSYKNGYPFYGTRTSTDVHKFALSGTDIAYRGSGNVPGHLGFDQNRKSFRMGEYQDTLRIITQSNPSWWGWGNGNSDESPGYLSILQESNGKLDLVGELPNARRPAPLGKAGEQLYATRFLGKRGYLVTYRLTDPLYVLDLSNPTDPYIAGELKVDGYSDYLFPLSDNLLLGVGKDAVVTTDSGGDGRFAWYQGVKLSLIDVTNPAQPREAARSVIGKRGSDATVLRDHHGIAIAGVGTNNVRISLPVSVNESAYSYSTGLPSDYYGFTRNELVKFTIDMGQKTLTLRGELPSFMPTLQRDISSDRSIIWNDQLHYYQSGDWKSGAW